ncbi:hypothetical protein [Gordonia sp. (in: high G+C Gram-positive bacteria)]|nr:hypothetical protein [Gordonia sp. (in: high G+C Gram-positive bacteria)]
MVSDAPMRALVVAWWHGLGDVIEARSRQLAAAACTHPEAPPPH